MLLAETKLLPYGVELLAHRTQFALQVGGTPLGGLAAPSLLGGGLRGGRRRGLARPRTRSCSASCGAACSIGVVAGGSEC
jgi:hypothetical protein